MKLSDDATKRIRETCDTCSQIYKVSCTLKKKYPSLRDADIVDATIEAVGDGPLLGQTDNELIECIESVYLKKHSLVPIIK